MMIMNQVREYLRLLSLFHYIVGGFLFLCSLFPGIYLAMGLMVLLLPRPEPPVITSVTVAEAHVEEAPAAGEPSEPATITEPIEAVSMSEGDEVADVVIGGLFISVGVIGILILWLLVVLVIVAGRKLARHRSHTYCMVIAGVECLFMPFGTVLGVLTLIVLLKPEARELFGLPALDDGDTNQGAA